MSDLDRQIRDLLSEEDQAFIRDSADAEGFYASMFDSLRGKGSGLYRWTWFGIIIFGSIMLFAIWKFFQVDTTRDQIMWAALAIMGNSAQIALKVFFNMRLNRRDILRELKRTQLTLAHTSR